MSTITVGKENSASIDILPPEATSRRQAKLIKNAKLVELPGGPHGVLRTHADQINGELVRFLGREN